MARRISEHSRSRKEGRKPFKPDLSEWKEICKISAYDQQIYRHFRINAETFYRFLDKERYKQEQDNTYKSEFVESYQIDRMNTKKLISNAFIKNIETGDVSSVIFGMKTYNGLIESKDIAHIELKKKEVALKSKEFLTNLANKFDLNFDELKQFAKKYFQDIDLDKY